MIRRSEFTVARFSQRMLSSTLKRTPLQLRSKLTLTAVFLYHKSIPLSRCRLRIDVVGSHEFSIIVGLPRLDFAREEDVAPLLDVVAAAAAVDVVVVVVVVVVVSDL